ncbi:MAG: zinc-binding dehydrogenase [SAR202 cluster bacterium]|nr:zinc-binding dehydrogenase [SAR202 cluster bacterium]
MKAAIYQGKQRFSLQEVPDPMPGPGQIQIDVSYAGVCGTDVHGFQHDKVPPGTILGHEFSGVVSRLGKGVTRWKVGDRIIGGGGTHPQGLLPAAFTMPRFDFRTDGFKVPQPKAYAEKFVMDDWAPLRTPDNVSDLEAALCEPAANAMRTIRRSGLKTGDTVAVIGAGPIGLFCLQIARASGAGKIIVVEPSPSRAKAAAKLGADEIVDPTKEDTVQRLIALTGGFGPHIVLECAAAPKTLQQALASVRRHGRVVLIALSWEPVTVSPVDWVTMEVELVTTLGALDEDFQATVALMSSGRITMEPLISESQVLPLESIQSTFEELITSQNRIQAVFKP